MSKLNTIAPQQHMNSNVNAHLHTADYQARFSSVIKLRLVILSIIDLTCLLGSV